MAGTLGDGWDQFTPDRSSDPGGKGHKGPKVDSDMCQPQPQTFSDLLKKDDPVE